MTPNASPGHPRTAMAMFGCVGAIWIVSTGFWSLGPQVDERDGTRILDSDTIAGNRAHVSGRPDQSHESGSKGCLFDGNTALISDTPQNPAKPDSGPRDNSRPDAESKAALKVLHDQQSAWNKGDLKSFMQGYWNSPELSFYSGRDKRKGWQETYKRFQERYQQQGREMGKLAFSELTADRLSATKMLVRGRWKLDMSDQTLDGLFSLILEKKPEGWRIIHDHTSMGEPAPKSPKK